jgi:hypothetical protein
VCTQYSDTARLSGDPEPNEGATSSSSAGSAAARAGVASLPREALCDRVLAPALPRCPLDPTLWDVVPGRFPADATRELLPVLAVGLPVDVLADFPLAGAALPDLADFAEATWLPADALLGLASLPVATRLTALETFAAKEKSGTSRRPAAIPPPSQMNLRRLAEDKPLPSSSGSVIPPPWV